MYPLESVSDFVCSGKHFVRYHSAAKSLLHSSSAPKIILVFASLGVITQIDSGLNDFTDTTTLTLEGSEVHNALALAHLI